MKKPIQISFSVVAVACLAVLLNASADYWRIVDYINFSNTFETELVEQETGSTNSALYHAFEQTEDLEETLVVEISDSYFSRILFSSFEKIWNVKFKEVSFQILAFDILPDHFIQSSIHPTTLG